MHLSRPDFVIIGAQKSASSFLQNCLSDHPEIFLPWGETAFFESPDFERSSFADLDALFAGRTERCLGIKRPSYLGRPEVATRLTAHLPDARLIAVLRNPVERAVSAYYHNINYGFLPPLSPEVGIPKILDDAGFVRSFPRAVEIAEFGFYHRQLQAYEHFRCSNQLLILLHEDITADPLNCIRKACRFLGVTDDFTPASLNARPQKVIYSLPRLKLLRLRNGLQYQYSADRLRLEPRNMSWPARTICRMLTRVDRHVLARFLPDRKPRLSDSLQSRLSSLYAADIASLEQYLGRDLSHWRSAVAAIH
jgi:hypothetical protein